MNIYDALTLVAWGKRVRRLLESGAYLCLMKAGPMMVFAVQSPGEKYAIIVDRHMSDEDLGAVDWERLDPGAVEWIPLHILPLMEDNK